MVEAAGGLQIGAVLVDCLEELRDSLAFVGDSLDDRDFPPLVAGQIHEDVKLLVDAFRGR